MSKNSTNTNESTNQTSTPNNLAALQAGWGAAQNLLGATSGNAAGQVNAGLNLVGTGANAASNAAIGGLNTAGMLAAPGGTANDANQYLTPFANGSMNGNNPFFQNMVDQLSRSIQGSTDGGFAAAGRYGSGANANAFNSALANEAGQLGYQNYGDALNRQTAAAGQLSTNNTNSTAQRINALDLINGLGSTATGAGAADVAAGQAPGNDYARIMALLGPGGGNVQGTGTGTSTTSGFDLSSMFGGGSTSPASGLLKLLGL